MKRKRTSIDLARRELRVRRWGVPVAWLTLCVVWSSTWLVIKIGLRDLPPISYAGIRFLVAIIVLFAVSAGRVGLLPQRGSDYLLLAFTGVLMFAVNYGLLFWGELHVSSGLAAILQATIPIFGMLSAHAMLPDEPLQLPKLLGALLALGGVALICERLLGFNGFMAFWGGLGIILGAASAAFSNVLLKARAVQLAPAMIAAWQMIFGAAPLLLIGFLVEGNPLKFHWTVAVDFLSALPRGNRFGAHLFASLLAIATNDCGEATSDLAHHATWRRRVRLGSWRRDIFRLVAARRVPGACRCVDDFPKRR